ncbi:MAG: aminoacetone oxidase family FAD-binding enzyme [Lachnospiraceae bacterium]|nr:aminoacetone oxidase family FAD-binding enzyme [Lachnospiraceae bacterium]
MYDLVIIGAGVSGLAAAISAKWENPQLNILILEKQSKCGRKLSASGNGKCNVTNEVFDEDCYHSSAKGFIADFVKEHSNSEVIDFFNKCGIPLYDDKGYYYPISNQAKQVTYKLLDLCSRLGVEIITDNEVTGIKDKTVVTKDREYMSRNVIIACGSNAWDKLGGSSSGYDLINKLGISMTNIAPGLTPIYVTDDKLKHAKGVRINGTATLHINDSVIRESGQIQINEDNLSGIAMINLSCYIAGYDKESLESSLWLDVMPAFTWDELKEYITKEITNNNNEKVRTMLEGFLPSAFVDYLLSRISINGDILLEKLSEKQLNKITSNIKKLTFTPVLQSDYSRAQVSLGGVAVSEINTKTFECIKHPGLYVVGELLDMTGKCGGYNISFAVLSGMAAAKDIAFK